MAFDQRGVVVHGFPSSRGGILKHGFRLVSSPTMVVDYNVSGFEDLRAAEHGRLAHAFQPSSVRMWSS